MRLVIQTLGWLVILQGISLGMLTIAVVGEAPVGVGTGGRILAAVVAGLIPVLAGLVALRNRRIAAKIDLCVASIAWLFFSTFHGGFGGILPAMAVFSGAIVIPGVFWQLAAQRNWDPPLGSSRLLRHRGVATALVCAIALVAFFLSLGFPWWAAVGDCGGRPLLDERGIPRNIDFTARIVLVGPRTYMGYSLWSIAQIEERFCDLNSWANMIILKGGFKPSDKSKKYFVEGGRSQAAFTYLLPVIEPVPCGRTGPSEHAEAAITILRDRLSKSGAH